MSWSDPFETLGLERTSDQTAIRRAYARKLKVTNPEDDAEAFQALRSAYEQALNIAQYIAQDEDDAADIPRTIVDEAVLSDAPGAEAAPARDPESPPAMLAPTQPWGAPRAPGDHVSGAEIDELNAAIARLEALLQDRDADRAAARAALRAVLASPAMDAMDVRDQVEQSVGVIVLNAGAHAVFMIDPATEAFQWDSDRLRGRSAIGQAVLARREGLLFLATMRNSVSDVNDAWKALSEPPKGGRWLRNRLTPGLPRKVRQALQTVDHQHPYLAEEFNPAALAWWRRYLAAPQLGPIAIWTAVGLPLIVTPVLAKLWPFGGSGASAFAAASAASLVGVVALLAAGLGLLRLQALWRGAREHEASAWEKAAWAPLALGALAAAAATPPAFAWGLVALAAFAAGWAIVTAEPGEGQDAIDVVWSFPTALTPLLQVPIHMPRWLHRALGLLALVVFGLALRGRPPAAPWAVDLPWAALAATAAATSAAFVFGGFTLKSAWREAPPRARAVGLGLGAAVAGGLPLWLWSTAPDARLAPLGFAVVTAVFLLERVVSLDEPPNRLRNALASWGWLPALIFADVLHSEVRQGNAALFCFGLWLLAAASIGLVSALRRERRGYGQAYA